MIRQIEAELATLSVSVAWADQAAFLIQLPGIGRVNAMTILAAIGEIERFPSAKHLVGYSGMGARARASGTTHRSGGITKQGRGELRAAMVEAAWKAVETNDHWKAQFERLADRIGRRKAAIVAIARKLLVVVFNVLSRRAPDQQADIGAVSRSLMNWGTHHRGHHAWPVPAGLCPARAGSSRLGARGRGLATQRAALSTATVRQRTAGATTKRCDRGGLICGRGTRIKRPGFRHFEASKCPARLGTGVSQPPIASAEVGTERVFATVLPHSRLMCVTLRPSQPEVITALRNLNLTSFLIGTTGRPTTVR